MLLALAGLGAAVTPAHADVAVAQLDRASPVAALGGVAAWSAYDPATGTYRLVLHRRGAVTATATAAASAPLDVSLGRDAAGRLVALYRRCSRSAPSGPADCDIYRYDVADAREELVGEVSKGGRDEGWPVQSGRRLAFVALRAGSGPGGRRCDVPYVKTLGSERPARRLDSGRCARTVGLSLRGQRLVQLTSGPASEGSPSELRRLDAGGGRLRLLSRISDREGAGHDHYRGTPSQSRGAVYVLRSTASGDRFVRVGLRSGRRSEVPARTELQGAFARDERGTSWYVESPAAFDCSYAQRPDVPCRLVRASADPFYSTIRRLAPRLRIDRPAAGDPPVLFGRLDRAVVRGRRLLRRDPLPGVAVELLARPAGTATRYLHTGLRASTDARGRWTIRATGRPNAEEFLAFTPQAAVASYAIEPLIGPDLVDFG